MMSYLAAILLDGHRWPVIHRIKHTRRYIFPAAGPPNPLLTLRAELLTHICIAKQQIERSFKLAI